jgi:hypothetical protein
MNQPNDTRVVGRVPFTDGTERDVYEEQDGRQWVAGGTGSACTGREGAGGRAGDRRRARVAWKRHLFPYEAKHQPLLSRAAFVRRGGYLSRAAPAILAPVRGPRERSSSAAFSCPYQHSAISGAT